MPYGGNHRSGISSMNALGELITSPSHAHPTVRKPRDLSRWPPRDYFVRSLAAGTEAISTPGLQTGRFANAAVVPRTRTCYTHWPWPGAPTPETPGTRTRGRLSHRGEGGEALWTIRTMRDVDLIRRKDNSTWGSHQCVTSTAAGSGAQSGREGSAQVHGTMEHGLYGSKALRVFTSGTQHPHPTTHRPCIIARCPQQRRLARRRPASH